MTMKPLYQDLPFPIDSHIHYYIEDLPHFIVPWHYHPAIEIMYITRGIGTRFVGDCIEQYEPIKPTSKGENKFNIFDIHLRKGW